MLCIFSVDKLVKELFLSPLSSKGLQSYGSFFVLSRPNLKFYPDFPLPLTPNLLSSSP